MATASSSINLGSVYATLELRDAGFAKQIDTAAASAQSSFNKLDKGIGSSLIRTGAYFNEFGAKVSNAGDRVGRLADTIGSPLFKVTAVAGVGLGFLAKSAFDMGREVENARLNLTTFTGSAEKASAITRELIKYATSDKGILFNRAELLNSAQNLALYGVETEKLTKNVQIMSKTVALGKFDFARLDEVIGRVLATGKLSGQEFDELTKAGIKLSPSLRNAAVTADQLFEALDKGVSDQVLSDRVNTIDGQMIRLKSAFQIAGAAIIGLDRETGKFAEGGAGQKFMALISQMTAQLKNPEVLNALKQIGTAFANTVAYILPLLQKLIPFLADNAELILKLTTAWFGAWAVLRVLSPALKVFGTGLSLIGNAANFAGLAMKVGFGGALTSVFPLLANPVFLIIVGVLAAIAAAAYLIYRNWDKIKPVVDQVVEAFKQFWETIKPIRDFIGNEFKVAITNLVVEFKKFWQAIQPLMPVLKILGAIILASFIAPIVAAIAVIALIIVAIAAVIRIVREVWQVIQAAWTAIRDTTVSVWNSVYSSVSSAMSSIWSVISPILNFIKNLYIIVFGTIAIVVINAMTIIKNIVETITTAIWNFISTIWNAIYETISGIVRRLIDFFAPAWNWLYDKGRAIVQGLVDGITSLASSVWSAIKGVADQIGRFFSGAWNWLYETGKAIVMGLINGIGSMLGSLNNKVQEIANSVKNKFAEMLKIRSPSKIFEGFGMNITQGLVNGIASGQSMVDKAVSSMVGNDVGNLYGNIAPGQVSALKSTDNSTRTVNITGPVNIADQQTADYFFERLGRQGDLRDMGLVGA